MKVKSSVYKGIEYIQINTLPADQRVKLLETLNSELLIKILADGKLIGNCIQFKDYEFWFDNIFLPQSPAALARAPRAMEESRSESLLGLNLK